MSEGELTAQPTTTVKGDRDGSNLMNGIILNDCYSNSASGNISLGNSRPQNLDNIEILINFFMN